MRKSWTCQKKSGYQRVNTAKGAVEESIARESMTNASAGRLV